jgi:hypothetical protein
VFISWPEVRSFGLFGNVNSGDSHPVGHSGGGHQFEGSPCGELHPAGRKRIEQHCLHASLSGFYDKLFATSFCEFKI